jgi:hypothetical protein
MAAKRAKTAEEYGEMVKQAVYEVEELRSCLEFDLEELQHFPAFLDPLEEGIKGVYEAMRAGEYRFSREDLPFMDLAMGAADEIPFLFLLKRINETHRRGLDVDGEDD